jgi:hypothetical protein
MIYIFMIEEWASKKARGKENNKQSSVYCLFIAGFLLGLLFNLEDGGGMFLWNVGELVLNCVALTIQKIVLFIVTAVQTSNATDLNLLKTGCRVWNFVMKVMNLREFLE